MFTLLLLIGESSEKRVELELEHEVVELFCFRRIHVRPLVALAVVKLPVGKYYDPHLTFARLGRMEKIIAIIKERSQQQDVATHAIPVPSTCWKMGIMCKLQDSCMLGL